ncbi:MAG: metallophosphoesterase [Planctomycetes bacterium]|nr:metallophosphoesterase [Planctomycetota bacterium]
MKRLWIGSLVIVGISVAIVLSGAGGGGWKTFFPLEDGPNPITHLRWNDDKDEFRFAVVSDRTGGHRPEIFAQAVEKLNLLQPEFVLSVGDLIEGGKKTDDKYAAEWKEFDGYVNKLTMPFFYVAGNHDAGVKESAKFWEGKLGRKHYHFVYRNVLFLMLNSDDPPGDPGAVGKEQLAWVQQTLNDNATVRWTIVAVHRPLWTNSNGAKNGWAGVEKALAGRSYTVFSGHVHRYEKFVRQGMNYYQFATTGGVSKVRGVEYGEFDHLVWVTMKKDGPVIANIMVDAVHTENLKPITTGEKGVSTANRKPTHPVRGLAYFDGAAMAGATVTFAGDTGDAKGVTAVGVTEADGSFRLSTYKAFDGAPSGEYRIGVTWKASGKTGPSLLPARYTTAAKSGLTATIKAGSNDVVLELKK